MNRHHSGGEAAIAPHANRFETNRRLPAETSEAIATRAAALLLGLELRRWLTNREKDYLDNLAPDNAITFLVRGGEYLHPAEIELFPAEIVDAALGQAGDSFFSHRFEDAGGRSCRVYTGVIGPDSGNPIVLGMFGPDDPINRDLLSDRFSLVLGSFRTALASVTLVAGSLPVLPHKAARLIVNRASGRVIHADPWLCEQVELEPARIVSREYGEIAPAIGRLVKNHRLKMENLSADHLELAAITFFPLNGRPIGGHIKVSDDLIDRIREDLAAMTSTAGYIEDYTRKLPATEVSELASDIVKAGERLDRRLARHQLLATFDRRETIEINVLYQLDQAIDRISKLGGRGIALKNDLGHIDLVRRAPSDAWLLLFESVLDTHRFARGTAGDTVVRVGSDSETGATHLIFTTVLPDTMNLADLERVWYQDTETLAARLDVTVAKNLVLESNTIVTRLTLGPRKGTLA